MTMYREKNSWKKYKKNMKNHPNFFILKQTKNKK